MLIPGRHNGIQMSEYRAIPYVTYGILRAVQKCPAKAKLCLANNVNQNDTDETRLGQAIHCAILEPGRFDLDYFPSRCQATNRNTGAPCGRRAEFRVNGLWFCKSHLKEDMPDFDAPVTADEGEIRTCKLIREAFNSHSGVQELLSVGLDSETSLIWNDPESNLPCKCRPDLLAINGSIAVDLKTTHDSVNHLAFCKKVVTNGYLHQAAFTRMACRALGIPLIDYFIVAIETNEPYCVAVFRLQEKDIDWAEIDLQSGLFRLSDCLSSGLWPGYEGIQNLHIPEEIKKGSSTN